jgi:uncharacterized protein YjbI with pentapeptide repeats
MAILYKAVVDQADFRGANLHHAVLIGTRGTDTVFTKAVLDEIYAPKVSLPRAQFDDAVLDSANLVSADLGGANFRHALLANANLQEANLQGADFNGADLSHARLDAADLRAARLHGANLATATGVTQAQLDTACIDEHTQLPSDLRRPAPCPPAVKKAAKR